MIGSEVGHFLVLEKLGKGGMGEVYKAKDKKLARVVALKFLSPELSDNPVFSERFLREAQAVAALNHPHICTIFETGEHEGRPFFAMELLEGKTLKEMVADGPLDIAVLQSVALQLVDALHAAHSKDILHRDLKPANIICDEQGNVKLLDFGLAKTLKPVAGDLDETVILDDPALGPGPDSMLKGSLTQTGSTLGTLVYMSPEQLRNEELDQRSDLFSLGLVLYEMATGRQAFSGNSIAGLINSILNDTVESPASLRPEVPAPMDSVIQRLLQKKREDRFSSSAETREALMLSSLPRASAQQGKPGASFLSTLGRKRSASWVAPGLLGVILLGVWIGLMTESMSSETGWQWQQDSEIGVAVLVLLPLACFLWWFGGRRLRDSGGVVKIVRLEEQRTNHVWLASYILVWVLAILMTLVIGWDAWNTWVKDDQAPGVAAFLFNLPLAAVFWFSALKGRHWRDHSPSRKWREIEIHGSYAQILANISLTITDLEASVTGLDLEEGRIRATTSTNLRTWGEQITFTVRETGQGIYSVLLESESVMPFEWLDLGKNSANVRRAVERLAVVPSDDPIQT
jgi:serine/threonine protein kinase